MATDDTERTLSTLIADCSSLIQRAKEISQGRKAAAKMGEEIRRAAGHVELALSALERRGKGAAASGSGWFRGRVANLANRLVRGAPDARTQMASSIASLRRVRREQGRDGFYGYSWAVSIPDLLGFLQVQGKTGVLRVTLESEIISIEFMHGDLVHAQSNNSPPGCRLGEILVEQGAIERERLQSFLVYYTASQGKLGRALELNELVTEDELRAGLVAQVQRLFNRLFDAENARFAFREGEIEVSADRTRLNVTQLLLESARIHDESRSERHLLPLLEEANEFAEREAEREAERTEQQQSEQAEQEDGEDEPVAPDAAEAEPGNGAALPAAAAAQDEPAAAQSSSPPHEEGARGKR